MHHSLISWEITHLYFFSWNFMWFLQKKPIKVQISGDISPNLYFDRLLLLKVYKVSAKKVQRSFVSWHWRVVQNLKKNRFVVWQIFTRTTWRCQNWGFDGILLSKVENAWAKNLQRSYVEWHGKMSKNMKRNWLVVSKLT